MEARRDRQFDQRELHTDRLTLKVLDPGYADRVLAYLTGNRAFAQPWNPRADEVFYTEAFQADRLRSDLEAIRAGSLARFWLFRRDDLAYARVIGHVALSNIIRGALQGCHLGYMIDQHENNHGLATEAVRRVIRFAFEELQLHRIEANIMPRNERSIRVAEKLGFAREGLSPGYLQINGVWEDHYRYGLINPEDKG